MTIEGDIGYWAEHHTGRKRCHDGYRNLTGGNLMTESGDLIGREGTAIMGGTFIINEATVGDQEREARAARRHKVRTKVARGECKKKSNGRQCGKGDQRGCTCRTSMKESGQTTSGLSDKNRRRQSKP